MPGSIGEGDVRRHMVCAYPLKASDCVCIGCRHQAVHYEVPNCKNGCENAGVRTAYKCEPVAQEGSNYGE